MLKASGIRHAAPIGTGDALGRSMSDNTNTPQQTITPHSQVPAPSAIRTAEAVEHDAHQWVQFVIRTIVLALSIFIWSVIGFLVWVPLLLRATLHMAGAVLYSTLLRKDTRKAAARLNHAMEFLPAGYARVFKAVGAGMPDRELDDDDDGGWGESIQSALRVAVEIVIAVLFWYLFGALLKLWALPALGPLAEALISMAHSLYTRLGGAA